MWGHWTFLVAFSPSSTPGQQSSTALNMKRGFSARPSLWLHPYIPSHSLPEPGTLLRRRKQGHHAHEYPERIAANQDLLFLSRIMAHERVRQPYPTCSRTRIASPYGPADFNVGLVNLIWTRTAHIASAPAARLPSTSKQATTGRSSAKRMFGVLLYSVSVCSVVDTISPSNLCRLAVRTLLPL